MKDNRFNPIDPSRENGRMYPNHSPKLDIDMLLLQSAMLAKKEERRLNIAGWTMGICFVIGLLFVIFN